MAARAFPIGGGKAFPKALANLRAALKGGIVGDDNTHVSGAASTELDVGPSNSRIRTGGSAGVEVVTLPAGTFPGQRHQVTLESLANVADSVSVQAGANSSLKQSGGAKQPAIVSKQLPATQYAAGTSVFCIAPVSGRISRVRTVVDVATTGAGAIDLKLATVLVAGALVVVATSASVGDLDDSGAIADAFPATNIVKAGDQIEIACTSTPSAGAVDVFIEITPDPEQPPVLIDAVLPATQYAAGASVFAIAPIAGNISRVRTVADVLTAGLGAVTLELATVKVVGSDVAIASAAAIGVLDDSGAIASGATTLVAAGDAIEIVSDGVPTAGALEVTIEITPLQPRGPVVVEKVYPETPLAAGTSVFAVSPVAGHISRTRLVTDKIVTGADVEVAVELGAALVVGSEASALEAASAVGDVADSTAIARGATTDVAAGGAIEITSDGGSTLGEVHVFLEIEPTVNVDQVDLAAVDEFAMFEFDGSAWALLYSSGAVS